MAEVDIDERNLGDQFESDDDQAVMDTEVKFAKLTPHQMNVRIIITSIFTVLTRPILL